MHMYVIGRRRKVNSSRGNGVCKDIGVRQHGVFNLGKCEYKARSINIMKNNVRETDRS